MKRTAICLMSLWIGAASAQAEEPADAMAALAPLEGDFAINGVRHTPDGPVALRETTGASQFILNGLVLEETRTSDLGTAEFVTLKTQISYDQYRDLYRVTVVDDTWGLMDVYEGDFAAPDVLEVTNLRSDTHFPLDDGRKMHFKLRWDLAAAPKTFSVLYSFDAGESWQPYFDETLTPTE